MAGVTSELYRTVQRTVSGLGYELVDLEWLGGGLLRVTLDAPDGIGLEDCERVSHQLTHLFAVEGVSYERLEVSSPGLDRPLKAASDYARFVGREINVQLHAPLAAAGGRKRLRGRLLQLIGAERLQLTVEDGASNDAVKAGRSSAKRPAPAVRAAPLVVEVALAEIEKARLVPELNFRPGRAGGKVQPASVGMDGSSGLGSEFR